MANKKNIIGLQVAALRLRRGMSQRDLAALVTKHGIQMGALDIFAIETDQSKVYDYEMLALARALDVTINDLYPAPKRRHVARRVVHGRGKPQSQPDQHSGHVGQRG